MYSYPPANQFSLSVTNNFAIMSGTATKRQTFNDLFAFSDDLTVVKGSHQLGFGADVRHWQLDSLGRPAPVAPGPLTAARPGTPLRIC